MEYFIPSWHKQYKDWSISVPNIDMLDATSHMRILKNNGYKLGLILDDYQPQLTMKINQLSYYPDKLFSIYDYLQGVDSLESQILKINDFNWPENAIWDFGPFRTLVVVEEKLIATVFYDIEGKILKIKYEEDKFHEAYTLIIDSRGFVSSKVTQKEQIFYNPYGNWRFKIEKNSGLVTINSKFNFCKQNSYSNINELVNEIFKGYIFNTLNTQDHLVVSLDNEFKLDISFLKTKQIIYLLNKKSSSLENMKFLPEGTIITNKPKLVQKVRELNSEKRSVYFIPTYNSEFKLGHSAREKVQEIVFFAENASSEDVYQIIVQLCNYVKDDSKNKKIRVFTYSLQKENEVNRVINTLKEKYKKSFLIGKNNKKNENDELEGVNKKESLPIIDLTKLRLTNISDLLKYLDKTRILISWGKPDELIQIAGISIGIPQIQNFKSNAVKDGKNGTICKSPNEIIKVTDQYLTDLTVWNKTVVYNVEMMNKYSEENILKKWKEVLDNKE